MQRFVQADPLTLWPVLFSWLWLQHHTEAPSPSLLPPSALPLDVLNNAVAGFSTVEDLIRYLEPDRWQLDLEDLYRPTWQLLGKAYIHGRKSRGNFCLFCLALQLSTSMISWQRIKSILHLEFWSQERNMFEREQIALFLAVLTLVLFEKGQQLNSKEFSRARQPREIKKK